MNASFCRTFARSHTTSGIGSEKNHHTSRRSPSGNTLTLFWPDTATYYWVESTLSFTPPGTWSYVPGTFQTNGGFISLGLPINGGQKFYRLSKLALPAVHGK